MIFLEDEITESASMLLGEDTETKLGNQLIAEAIVQDALAESNQTILDEDILTELLSEELLSEKNILKWDKYAKRKYATNKSVLVIAKEKNDKDFKKLVKVMKMRRLLLNKLGKKYGNKAKLRARQQEQNHKLAGIISKLKNKNVHVQADDQKVEKK